MAAEVPKMNQNEQFSPKYGTSGNRFLGVSENILKRYEIFQSNDLMNKWWQKSPTRTKTNSFPLSMPRRETVFGVFRSLKMSRKSVFWDFELNYYAFSERGKHEIS